MLDSRKLDEIKRKMQDFERQISTRKSNIDRIKRDKEYKMKDFDSQIKREDDEITRINRQIDDLKKQLK